MKKFFFPLLTIMIFSLGIFTSPKLKASEYKHSDYVSLYQFPSEYVPNGDVIGYKNMFNFDNPVIRCTDGTLACSYPEESALERIAVGELQRYRVYIPPGTKSIGLTTFLEQPSYYIVVARFGKPIENDINYLSDLSDSEYANLPADGFGVSELTDHDCVGKNSSGYLKVVNDYIDSSVNGWLYVIVIRKSGSVINNHVSNWVNTANFMDWFRTASWDASGDPAESGNSTPVPSLPGDLNQDRKVDIFDYNLFLPEFGKVVANNLADLDKNGKVDIFDYNLFLGNFGRNS